MRQFIRPEKCKSFNGGRVPIKLPSIIQGHTIAKRIIGIDKAVLPGGKIIGWCIDGLCQQSSKRGKKENNRQLSHEPAIMFKYSENNCSGQLQLMKSANAVLHNRKALKIKI